MPKSENDKQKRLLRRKNHIKKDLLTPKYRERSVGPKLSEDEVERRIRRYGYGVDED